MTVDEELLKKAIAMGERLGAAEREALLARAEYHTVVRRLHLAGASMREIAQALGISHQRVAQIVEEAGGSWWQRIWRTRNRRRDAVCTFCTNPPSEVAKLIAGPDVYICDRCVSSAERVAGGGRAPDLRLAADRACGFCGKRRRPIVAGRANVCAGCLAQCRSILDERA